MEQSLAERLPPYNRDAEQSVLGCMIRDNPMIDEIVSILPRGEYFYTEAHQQLFQAIVKLHNDNHPVDVVTLFDYITKNKLLEDVPNQAAYLAELYDAAPTTANAQFYARIVRDKGVVRNLIHSTNDIIRSAYDQSMSADELLESAERKILEIAEMGATADTISLREALKLTFEKIDARKGKDVSLGGIPSGYLDLDEKIVGFQQNELIIIAARPSVGKTAFALNLLRNIVVDQGISAFFVSLEQSRTEIAERLICCQARINSHRLRKGELGTQEMIDLNESAEELSDCQLFIDDAPGQSMLRIAANARRLKRQHNIKIIVIDYLQLIDPENKRESRQEQVAGISRRLKFLARELHIPVVALAQVNRGTEDRQDHRPRLSDLRESGSIEQDADTVMLLHRPDYYEPGQQEGVIEVIIGKQRNGPTGEITLTFLKQFMRFENFAVEPPFGFDN